MLAGSLSLPRIIRSEKSKLSYRKPDLAVLPAAHMAAGCRPVHCIREKKEMKKIFTKIMLLVLALPLLFGSCDTEKTPSDSSTDDETTAMESTLKIVEDGIAVFTVVYPDEPGAELFARVRELVDTIKEATGATLKLNSDFISWNTVRDPEAYEILVGRTNYDETAQVLSELRACDYAIRAVGNKIVITAHTDELIRRAVSYFCKNLIERNLVTGEDGKSKSIF